MIKVPCSILFVRVSYYFGDLKRESNVENFPDVYVGPVLSDERTICHLGLLYETRKCLCSGQLLLEAHSIDCCNNAIELI